MSKAWAKREQFFVGTQKEPRKDPKKEPKGLKRNLGGREQNVSKREQSVSSPFLMTIFLAMKIVHL